MSRLRQLAYRLLRKSEKYAKTDMVYITTNGFWLLTSQIIGALLSLAMAVVFAHTLSKEAYGSYKYLLSALSLLTIASYQGIGPAFTQSVARGFEGSLKKALTSRVRWGFLGSAIAFLGSFYYFQHANSTLGWAFIVLGLAAPFFDSLGLYDSFLRGKKLFQISSLLQIISKLISSVALIITLLLTNNVIIILTSFSSIFILSEYALYRYTVKRYPPNTATDPGLINYGKHLSYNALIGTVAAYLDKILVYHFLGAIPLAVYSFAIAMPEQMKAGQKAIDALIFPKFSTNEAQKIQANIGNKFLRLFLLYTLITVAYIIAAPWLFHWLFPQYSEAIWYSQLFSLSIVAAAINPAFTYLQAKKKIKQQYYNNIITSLFQVAIMVVFIINWGLLGLIWARIITRFVSSGLNFVFYHTGKSELD